jgi:hypothetical protein
MSGETCLVWNYPSTICSLIIQSRISIEEENDITVANQMHNRSKRVPRPGELMRFKDQDN